MDLHARRNSLVDSYGRSQHCDLGVRVGSGVVTNLQLYLFIVVPKHISPNIMDSAGMDL